MYSNFNEGAHPNIDSSQRKLLNDSNVYQNINNYVIRLENPIYDVSQIKLVSARIPTPNW